MTSTVIDIWRSGRVERLAEVLAEDVTFSSPVTDYLGREAAGHLLGLIPRALGQVEVTAAWPGGADVVTAFTARVAGGPEVQGVLRERRGEAGALVHVTLFLRPFSALRAGMARMRELLESDPVPTRPS